MATPCLDKYRARVSRNSTIRTRCSTALLPSSAEKRMYQYTTAEPQAWDEHSRSRQGFGFPLSAPLIVAADRSADGRPMATFKDPSYGSR
jgi:hypothetical protein